VSPILKERRLLHSHSILLVAGPEETGGSWQAAWRRRHPRFRRTSIDATTNRNIDSAARTIAKTAQTCWEPAVVVASGLGCLAVIRAASLGTRAVAGALLVSPLEPEGGHEHPAPEVLRSFPTVVVIPRRITTGQRSRTAALAARWGSELVDVSARHEAGDQNDEWPAGLDLLERLCRRLAALRVMKR
jgi:predicted alpha/beta hydrolase family esterase